MKFHHDLYLLSCRIAQEANGKLRARGISDGQVLLNLIHAAKNQGRPWREHGGTVAKSYDYRAYTAWTQAARQGDRLRVTWGQGDAHHISWQDGWSGYSQNWTEKTCKERMQVALSVDTGILLGRRRIQRLTKMSTWACLAGDVYAVRVHGVGSRSIWARYDSNGQKTGIAIPMPKTLQTRFGRWEHGKTVRQALEEIERKMAVFQQEETERKLSLRQQRAARLLARISTRLFADYDSARKAGYCDVGIRAWADSRGIDVTTPVLVSTLYADPDNRAKALAVRVAGLQIAMASA